MFNKRKQEFQLSLNQFNAELAALIDRAIAARIHLVDIDHCLEDRLQTVRFKYAQRPVV